ncbi:RNA-directed DNA polymerase, partial [Escherichia coli]|uniref:RNA-directed DNA polymerase n=1 Tax=Escherichia coli TaxID=562 RepID=UPI0020253F40
FFFFFFFFFSYSITPIVLTYPFRWQVKICLRSSFFVTDITDCYGSIYPHSLAWAIGTREVAKEKKRDKNLLGNIIDSAIQNMQCGQTNGIPQGSVLMDFIAEI